MVNWTSYIYYRYCKYKDKNILIVTHGGVARGVYFYFNEIPKDGKLENFGSGNCEIKEYEL